jgi:hypothetical protein
MARTAIISSSRRFVLPTGERNPRSKFTSIDRLYDPDVLAAEIVQNAIETLKKKLATVRRTTECDRAKHEAAKKKHPMPTNLIELNRVIEQRSPDALEADEMPAVRFVDEATEQEEDQCPADLVSVASVMELDPPIGLLTVVGD